MQQRFKDDSELRSQGGPVAEVELDLDFLAENLRDRIDAEDMTLRTAAEEIGCSPATLSRMLQGSSAPNMPDSVNVLRAVSWLGMSVGDFETHRGARAKSSVNEVAAHLRALPGLSKPVAEALVAAVKAAYDSEKKIKSSKKR